MADEYEEVEKDLDEKIMDDFASKLEFAINMVLQDHADMDCRLELLSTLLSFASQVGKDVGIEETNFKELAEQFYKEQEETEFDKKTSN